MKRRLVLPMLAILLVALLALPQVVTASGSPSPVPGTTTVNPNLIAPANHLQIVDNIPGATAAITGYGTGYNRQATIPAGGTSDGGALWTADWNTASTRMFTQFAGGGRATTVQFKPSNTAASNYNSDPNAGWNSADLSLSTTTMTVTVKYTNAAYYQGRAVDAIATFKVTPMKNRYPDQAWMASGYGNAQYWPTIQFSDNLSLGWCWQNVKEFHANISFYEKSGSKIILSGGSFEDIEGTYYTINSLNPGQTQDNNSRNIGPEYAVPDAGTYQSAYIIPVSHIGTTYNGGSSSGTQNAYNGGTASWDGDDPFHDNWSQNSVMFTLAPNTDRISLTMGNLESDPPSGTVKRTNFVWMSISTQSFSNQYVTYMDIPVTKTWSSTTDRPAQITVDLYYKYQFNETDYLAVMRSETVQPDASGNWNQSFLYVPTEDSLLLELAKKHGTDSANILNLAYGVAENPLPDSWVPTVSGNSAGFIIYNEMDEEPADPTKAADPVSGTNVAAGSAITYTVNYKNHHAAAADVMITDALDSKVTYVAGSASDGGVYDAGTHTVSWTLADAAAKTAGSVSFQVTVKAEAAGQSVVNGAGVKIGNDAEVRTNTVTHPVDEEPVDPTYPTLRIPLTVNKVLKNGRLKGGEFTFQLKDRNGKVIAEVMNAADGTVTFPDRTFSKEVSNWTYTIREMPGTDPHITYDNTIYTVMISTKAADDHLTAKVNIEKNGIPYAGSMIFTNVRATPQTGDSIYQVISLLLSISVLLICVAYILKHKRMKDA